MKRTIRIIDNTKPGKQKVLTSTVTIRDLDHLQAQQTYRAQVFADRRKKDPKHKKKYLEEI